MKETTSPMKRWNQRWHCDPRGHRPPATFVWTKPRRKWRRRQRRRRRRRRGGGGGGMLRHGACWACVQCGYGGRGDNAKGGMKYSQPGTRGRRRRGLRRRRRQREAERRVAREYPCKQRALSGPSVILLVSLLVLELPSNTNLIHMCLRW